MQGVLAKIKYYWRRENNIRIVDATERTRFSKSRPNDLEDIGQGQGSSHATHPLMPLIISTKHGKNPSWTVDATEWTRGAGRTDGWTDGQTDGRTEWNQYTPPPPTILLCVGYNYNWGIDILKSFKAIIARIWNDNIFIWSLRRLDPFVWHVSYVSVFIVKQSTFVYILSLNIERIWAPWIICFLFISLYRCWL